MHRTQASARALPSAGRVWLALRPPRRWAGGAAEAGLLVAVLRHLAERQPPLVPGHLLLALLQSTAPSQVFALDAAKAP
jgi:hypothetical protein